MMSPASPLLRRAVATIAMIAVIAALCLAVVLARSWRISREATKEMRVVFRAQAPILEQADKREQQRHFVLGKDLAKIAREERTAKTPADIATRLVSAFPPLPQPVTVSLRPSAPATPQMATEPPAFIAVPQADLQPLFVGLEQCRACEERLAVVQQDLDDERAKVAALTVERDAATKTARGGGFWARLRVGTKWFVIGGALGALAAYASHR
jgi:hypothetical protein